MALHLQIQHFGWRRVNSGARLDMGYAHAQLILRSPRIFLRAGLTPDEANLLSFPLPAPLLAPLLAVPLALASLHASAHNSRHCRVHELTTLWNC